MSWLKSLFGTTEGQGTAVAEPAIDSRTVEEIIADLRKRTPGRPYCFTVLFGDRPLTGKMGGGESVMIFSTRELAESFMRGYQGYYRTTKPLSVLGLGSLAHLWGMLNNASADPLYTPPLGLIINFSYSGGSYNTYDTGQLKNMGPEGLQKGLNQVL